LSHNLVNKISAHFKNTPCIQIFLKLKSIMFYYFFLSHLFLNESIRTRHTFKIDSFFSKSTKNCKRMGFAILLSIAYLSCVNTSFSFSDLFFPVLRRAFSMFDSGKKGSIEKEKVRTILTTLGQTYDDKQLDSLLDGEDPEGKRQSTFSHKYLSYDT
jgi:hypothetical protein